MATIVTRAGKGSALTHTEGDANFTNLNTNKLENIVEDTTPQLGGNLDLNNFSLTTSSTLAPASISLQTSNSVVAENDITITAGKSGASQGQINIQTNTLVGDTRTTLPDTFNFTTTGESFNLSAGGTGTGGQITLNAYDVSNGAVTIQGGNNGNISLTPQGTGNLILDGLYWPQTDGTANQVLKTNGSGQLSWTTSGTFTSFTLAGDSGTSQTIENLDTVTIAGGTGLTSVASATDTITINLDNTAVTPASYTYASITVDAQGRITAASNGTAPTNVTVSDDTTTNATRYILFEDATSGTVTAINVASTKLTFNPSTGRLSTTQISISGSLSTNNGANGVIFRDNSTGILSTDLALSYNPVTDILTAGGFSGPINGTIGATTANTGAFTTLSASSTVSGTGFSTYLASPPDIGGTTAAAVSATTLTFKDPREAIYDLGTTGGTIAPNVANGSVQKITLNSALTINAFTTPVAGQSLTLIIFGGTAYTSITSTMKFAGGIKTLTGTASCIDILSVYYDGTNYYASLNKGFA